MNKTTVYSTAFLPLFVKGQSRPMLIVGGGMIATRKLRAVSKAGMRLTVVAPQVSSQISLLDKHRSVTWIQRKFKDTDIDGMFAVIAATNDYECNAHISQICQQKDILVNNVNSAEASTFILPNVVGDAPLQIAVSTGGTSPTLARLLAKHLANCTPPAYAQLAQLMGTYRQQVKETFADAGERRLFWETVLCGQVSDLMFSGRRDEAETLFRQILRDKNTNSRSTGEVYLVGAGPGDPELLTFKALRLMQQASIVIYDRLVSSQIMDLLHPDTKKIYAGKERSKHTIEQANINQLLVDYAKQGHRVLRLKGGDPFIFGRGGEEIETLMEENIPFQIVPGITAASGCAAYAGIPLTHRDYAQNCVFVTGHLKDGSVNLDWEMLSQSQQTVIIYMGLQGLQQICEKLIEHGLADDTPVALITRGTLPEQIVLTGTLSTLPAIVKNTPVKPPTLMIVGKVVTLHDKLQWYHAECINIKQ